VRIAYEVAGHGPPVVLVHGFAANIEMNWKRTGWFRVLTRAGYQVVALDCRGHGQSDKPHDAEAYAGDRMSTDVVRLMDRLGLEQAELIGYSMGGLIATFLLVHHANRFSSVVIAGMGSGAMGHATIDATAIAETLDAPNGQAARSTMAREFRAFAERAGNDLTALAAIMRARPTRVTPEELGRVDTPVLIVVGEKDELVRDPRPLAEAIPSARLVIIPDKDHLTTVPDHRYKEAVLDFLSNNDRTPSG
jgi:pimeloyl-ACP methyl ester carboxylesterase